LKDNSWRASLRQRRSLFIQSNAFRKSLKSQKVDLPFLFRVSIILVKLKWSTVLWFLRKPFCSSAKTFLSSDHYETRILSIFVYILYIDEAKEIPRYDIGSLWSLFLDLGIGLIILLAHKDSILLVWKHTLNRLCKTYTDVSVLIVFFLNVCCVLVFYVFFFYCSVIFFVYGPFCHGAL